MSSQAHGQWFRVSRGGCWQCVSDCRSRLAEVLTFSSVAYNGPQVVAVALHGPQPAVMGWPTTPETLGKCGKVKKVEHLFGPFGNMPLYLGHQRTTTRHETPAPNLYE